MLPALSFRVSQAGRLLTLPLEELLLPLQADGRREFCIRSHPRSAADAGLDEPSREVPILLGSQALHGFVTVFDMASRKARVGLLPKRREEGEEGAERRRRRRR